MNPVAANILRIAAFVAIAFILFGGLFFGGKAYNAQHPAAPSKSDTGIGFTYNGKVGTKADDNVVVPFSGGPTQLGY